MRAIEIRLDPVPVRTMLEFLSPVLESLEGELASPAILPEEDELLEDFWKNDLLDSQRAEIAVIKGLFDDSFMENGRAMIEPEDMDRVLRSCSAIRLKLRETTLKSLKDSELEEGDMESVEWTKELQIGYGAYALFASLQEIIVSQLDVDSGEELDEFGVDEGDVQND